MSDGNYPLCKAVGLNVSTAGGWKALVRVVPADDVEKLLAAASVVFSGPGIFPAEVVWNINQDTNFHTHSARLLLVQPIVRDSAEQLVTDLVNSHTKFNTDTSRWAPDPEYWIERAKRLLERK